MNIKNNKEKLGDLFCCDLLVPLTGSRKFTIYDPADPRKRRIVYIKGVEVLYDSVKKKEFFATSGTAPGNLPNVGYKDDGKRKRYFFYGIPKTFDLVIKNEGQYIYNMYGYDHWHFTPGNSDILYREDLTFSPYIDFGCKVGSLFCIFIQGAILGWKIFDFDIPDPNWEKYGWKKSYAALYKLLGHATVDDLFDLFGLSEGGYELICREDLIQYAIVNYHQHGKNKEWSSEEFIRSGFGRLLYSKELVSKIINVLISELKLIKINNKNQKKQQITLSPLKYDALYDDIERQITGWLQRLDEIGYIQEWTRSRRWCDKLLRKESSDVGKKQSSIAIERSKRSRELEQLKKQFFTLRDDEDRQHAGLQLEKVLNRLFALNDLSPREAFRVVGEQIDGSFLLDHEVYLLEVKWTQYPSREAELLIFRGKIEGKSKYTRGVFVTISGVSKESAIAIMMGKQQNFFIVDGYDLTMILEDNIELKAFLRMRQRLLAEEGQVIVPFKQLET